MTKEERHSIILDQLIKKDSVLVTDLASILNVTSVTIRKDLTELEIQGKLYRSHGKAILIDPFTINRSVNDKERLYQEEKMSIGYEAAQLITHDDFILIASGTTLHNFARCIHPKHRLTAMTSSTSISQILSQKEDIDIIQLGGTLRHSSLSVVGDYSKMMLSECSFSKLFLGVDGIDFDFGITTTDIREARLNKAMMEASQKIIVLADLSKFGKRGFAKISNLEDIDIIITDEHIKKADVLRIEELGIKLVIARCNTQVNSKQ
ncbi:DeoR/GlpR family DNA-binding transcription regulator [Prevotella amnii]|uniref:DeoR/GlpR family DNA-binding transcription regulator n=1 Tax=Prevotella amnii TaxID=419005 RepID=UPI00336A11C3